MGIATKRFLLTEIDWENSDVDWRPKLSEQEKLVVLGDIAIDRNKIDDEIRLLINKPLVH